MEKNYEKIGLENGKVDSDDIPLSLEINTLFQHFLTACEHTMLFPIQSPINIHHSQSHSTIDMVPHYSYYTIIPPQKSTLAGKHIYALSLISDKKMGKSCLCSGDSREKVI